MSAGIGRRGAEGRKLQISSRVLARAPGRVGAAHRTGWGSRSNGTGAAGFSSHRPLGGAQGLRSERGGGGHLATGWCRHLATGGVGYSHRQREAGGLEIEGADCSWQARSDGRVDRSTISGKDISSPLGVVEPGIDVK